MKSSRPMLRQGFFALLFVVGCTKSEIVYRDRAPFNPAPDAASGMLGYYDVGTKQTTCGNCHVGQQATWAETKHAGAYQTLADLPAAVAQASCYSCHTVSTNGNGAATPKRGWDVVKADGYHDVQCESCHGPGTVHVSAPSRTNVPLARVGMAGKGIPAAAAASSNASCEACHSGAHSPFAEEWGKSGHANVVAESGTPVAANVACAPCHNGKATLTAWGVNTNYIEKDSAAIFPVTCAVCHDPHAKNNPKQLRFSITAVEPTANLCMKCHDRRAILATGTTRLTPHAPQGDVLLGTAGYRPPGVVIEGIAVATTHASSANSKLCAGCHIQRYTFTDAASGNFVFQSTGHRFLPIPCVDANGPTDDQSCAYTTAARSFKGCVNGGCHNSEAIASSAFNSRRATIAVLADQIWTDLNHNEALDASPVDGGYLALVKLNRPTEFPATNAQATKITPAMGAFFNMATFAERYSNGDRSKGVHNPFLGSALLAGDINELRAAYSFLPAPPAAVQAAVETTLRETKLRQPNLFRDPTRMNK